MLIAVPPETTAGEPRVAATPETARKPLLIGVPKETAAEEKRVATVPDVVEKLVKLGFSPLAVSWGTPIHIAMKLNSSGLGAVVRREAEPGTSRVPAHSASHR